MPRLFDTIRSLVLRGRYIVGEHATERLDERGILEWQVVDGIERGSLIIERPDDTPHPAVEVKAVIPDADPSEACYEPHTIELLRQVEQHAKLGDVTWLKQHGKVYAALEAA